MFRVSFDLNMALQRGRLHITFILPAYVSVPVGGFRVVYEYANRLVERGHAVRIAHSLNTLNAPFTDRLRSRSAWKNLFVTTPREVAVPWFALDSRVESRVYRDLSRLEIDLNAASHLIVATSWRTAPVVARIAWPERGAYFIQHYETWDGEPSAIDATWRLPLSKIVIARWLVDKASELSPGTEVAYVPNGIDFECFERVVPFADRPRYRVGMLYHAYGWKGSADGIQALELVRSRLPDVDFQLFGTDKRPKWLPHWCGYTEGLSGRPLEQYYNSLRVFLHTSYAEGWPLPPAEAMACGASLVAADNPGVLEYADDSTRAVVVRRGDVEGFADAVTMLLANPDYAEALADAGSRYIRTYTWDRAVDAFESALRGIDERASR